jgi:hypothetical protein
MRVRNFSTWLSQEAEVCARFYITARLPLYPRQTNTTPRNRGIGGRNAKNASNTPDSLAMRVGDARTLSPLHGVEKAVDGLSIFSREAIITAGPSPDHLAFGGSHQRPSL